MLLKQWSRLRHRNHLLASVGIVNMVAIGGGMMTTWASPILTKLSTYDDDNPLGSPVTSIQSSLIAALMLLGVIAGPFLFNPFESKIGKKLLLLLAVQFFTISFLMAAFSKVVELFYVVRILSGVGLGIALAVIPLYIVEVSDVEFRSMLTSMVGVSINTGAILSYTLGPYMSVTLFNLIELIIPVIATVLFYFLPETPYYLIKKNRRGEAETVLAYLRNKPVSEVMAELKQIEDEIQRENTQTKGSFSDIFKTRSVTRAFIIVIVLIISSQLTGITVILTYAQIIFTSAGISVDSAIPPIILGTVQLLGAIIIPTVIGRFGIRTLLLVSGPIMIIAESTFGLYFYLQDDSRNVENISWLSLVTLIIFALFYNVGFAAVPFILLPEIVPGNMKPIVSSIGIACFNLTSFALLFSYNALSEAVGIGICFWIYAGTTVLAVMFIVGWLPETKGKSFQEIQDILAR